jgi:hypothetical protein
LAEIAVAVAFLVPTFRRLFPQGFGLHFRGVLDEPLPAGANAL